MVEQERGENVFLKDIIFKCSGFEWDVSFGNMSKSICNEIIKPFFVGCMHMLCLEFCWKKHSWGTVSKVLFMFTVTRLGIKGKY